MGYIGDKYTWRCADVRERLDRVVCNVQWTLAFPNTSVIHEKHYRSDHRPILVDMEYYKTGQIRRRSGGKKFVARWLSEDIDNKVVATAWAKANLRGLGPGLQAARTQAVHNDLHSWDKSILKGPKNHIKKLSKELEKIRHHALSPTSWVRQKELQLLIDNLLEQE
uniref:Endonuclease/exonuclease/phosphatase domain-containing protein n=1 Tax=Triticum urartu TaxID=4572 RepID=A0A8R7UT88_TRIUA